MGKRGPKIDFPDRLQVTYLPEGGKARLKRRLRDGETMADFQRNELMRAVKRREAEDGVEGTARSGAEDGRGPPNVGAVRESGEG